MTCSILLYPVLYEFSYSTVHTLTVLYEHTFAFDPPTQNTITTRATHNNFANNNIPFQERIKRKEEERETAVTLFEV